MSFQPTRKSEVLQGAGKNADKGTFICSQGESDIVIVYGR